MSVILTRNMSLSLPAHPPGHLSPKIVCTSLAWILKLPLWGGLSSLGLAAPRGEKEQARCQWGPFCWEEVG